MFSNRCVLDSNLDKQTICFTPCLSKGIQSFFGKTSILICSVIVTILIYFGFVNNNYLNSYFLLNNTLVPSEKIENLYLFKEAYTTGLGLKNLRCEINDSDDNDYVNCLKNRCYNRSQVKSLDSFSCGCIPIPQKYIRLYYLCYSLGLLKFLDICFELDLTSKDIAII